MELTNLEKLRVEKPQRKKGLNVRLWRGYSGALSNVPREIVYHSLDGYEWGYSGSGPADLALNILYCFLDYPRAWNLHQPFKEDFLAGMLANGGTIDSASITKWIDKQLAAG